MGKETGISWTEHTFNPWWGCTEVSPGCDNCYAREFDARVARMDAKRTGIEQPTHWGKGAPRRRFTDSHWMEPVHWNRIAQKEKRKHLVFCASMADIMDDEAPEGERDRLWRLVDDTPWLTWQLLTKRPHRYDQGYLPREFRHKNFMLGTTAEDQQFYDVRWPILRDSADRRGALAWISYEPALGPLTMTGFNSLPDWIIFGGESGANRRPTEAQWARDLLAECRTFGVAYFMKQMGGATPAQGKALIPADLLVQEYPA